MELRMGGERWGVLAALLTERLRRWDGQGVLPVSRTLRAFGMEKRGVEEKGKGGGVERVEGGVEVSRMTPWGSFLRNAVLYVNTDRAHRRQLAQVIQAIRNGEVPQENPLPGDFAERSTRLAHLLLSAAREFGENTLADFAIDLLREHSPQISYAVNKELMYVNYTARRRWMDQELRNSGEIRTMAQRLLYRYVPAVDKDRAAARVGKRASSSVISAPASVSVSEKQQASVPSTACSFDAAEESELGEELEEATNTNAVYVPDELTIGGHRKCLSQDIEEKESLLTGRNKSIQSRDKEMEEDPFLVSHLERSASSEYFSAACATESSYPSRPIALVMEQQRELQGEDLEDVRLEDIAGEFSEGTMQQLVERTRSRYRRRRGAQDVCSPEEIEVQNQDCQGTNAMPSAAHIAKSLCESVEHAMPPSKYKAKKCRAKNNDRASSKPSEDSCFNSSLEQKSSTAQHSDKKFNVKLKARATRTQKAFLK